MVKITACVIVKNEERNITKWLECVKRITRDMVVVDTGSEDKTVEIAQQGGAKVFHFSWINDFSAAKNFAISQAKGEWILFLDADEYFSEQSIKNLRRYVEIYHYKPQVDALVCKIINIDAQDHNRFISEFYNLRLFRNKPELRYERPLHEMLERSDGELQAHILPDGVEIYHTGYSATVIQHKLKRNLKILLDEIAEIGIQPYHYRYLCECYNGLRDDEMAEKYAKLFIEKGERTLGTDNSIHKQLIGCMINLKRDEQLILAKIDEFIKEFPGDPEFLWYKGELFFIKKDYVRAEQALRQFITQCEAGEGRVEYGETSLKKKWCRAYYPLGIIAQLKGEEQQAIDYFCESLRRYRFNSPILRALLQMLNPYTEQEIIRLLGGIYDQSETDISFILEHVSSANFPAMDYYKRVLGEDCGEARGISTDDMLRDTGEHLTELYEILILSLLLNPLRQDDGALMILLPPLYQQAYRKLKGDAVELTPIEENVYLQLAHQLKTLRVGQTDKKMTQETQAAIEKCLAEIAANAMVDYNCDILLEVCRKNKIQYGELICFLNVKAKEKKNTVLRIATSLYQRGKTAEAIRFMIAALKFSYGDEDFLYALALLFNASGDKENALKLLASYQGHREDLLQLKNEIREN